MSNAEKEAIKEIESESELPPPKKTKTAKKREKNLKSKWEKSKNPETNSLCVCVCVCVCYQSVKRRKPEEFTLDLGSPAKGLGLSLQHSTLATNKDIPPTSPPMILSSTCSSSSDDGVLPISSPEVKVCLNVDSHADYDSLNNEASNKVSVVIIRTKPNFVHLDH